MSTVVVQDAPPPSRFIARTPSPTPSEQVLLERQGLIDWQKMKNWRWWFRKEWICASNAAVLYSFPRIACGADDRFISTQGAT